MQQIKSRELNGEDIKWKRTDQRKIPEEKNFVTTK